MLRERATHLQYAPMSERRKEEYHNDAGRLAKMICYANLHTRKEIEEACSQFVEKWEGSVAQEVALANATSTGIIGNALDSIQNALPKAELLIAMLETNGMEGSLGALTSSNFIEGLNKLDSFVSGALVYEIGITKNFESLTDQRIFTSHSINFLNRLDVETSSGWFSSMARTGNVELLTSGRAMSAEMLDFINNVGELAEVGSLAGKMSGDLSFLIGEGRHTEELTSPRFLKGLSGMDLAAAAQYINEIFVNGGNPATSLESRPNAPGVLLVNPGSVHDRNALMIGRELRAAGFNVTFASPTADSSEIARLAGANNIQAVGIGLSTDVSEGIVKNRDFVFKTIDHINLKGLDGVAVFVGGRIDQKSARGFEQKGIKVMGQGSLAVGTVTNYGYRVMSAEVIGFLNIAIRGAAPASISYGARIPPPQARLAVGSGVAAGENAVIFRTGASASVSAAGSAAVGYFDYEKQIPKPQPNLAGIATASGGMTNVQKLELLPVRFDNLPVNTASGTAEVRRNPGSSSAAMQTVRTISPAGMHLQSAATNQDYARQPSNGILLAYKRANAASAATGAAIATAGLSAVAITAGKPAANQNAVVFSIRPAQVIRALEKAQTVAMSSRSASAGAGEQVIGKGLQNLRTPAGLTDVARPPSIVQAIPGTVSSSVTAPLSIHNFSQTAATQSLPSSSASASQNPFHNLASNAGNNIYDYLQTQANLPTRKAQSPAAVFSARQQLFQIAIDPPVSTEIEVDKIQCPAALHAPATMAERQMNLLLEENRMLRAAVASLKSEHLESAIAIPEQLEIRAGLKTALRDVVASSIRAGFILQPQQLPQITEKRVGISEGHVQNRILVASDMIIPQAVVGASLAYLPRISMPGFQITAAADPAVLDAKAQLDGKRVKMLPALLKGRPVFVCFCSCHNQGR